MNWNDMKVTRVSQLPDMFDKDEDNNTDILDNIRPRCKKVKPDTMDDLQDATADILDNIRPRCKKVKPNTMDDLQNRIADMTVEVEEARTKYSTEKAFNAAMEILDK